MPKEKYYAVAEGRNPGVYRSWDDCNAQVHGYSGGIHKSFPTQGQAENFVQQNHGSSGQSYGRSGGSGGYDGYYSSSNYQRRN